MRRHLFLFLLGILVLNASAADSDWILIRSGERFWQSGDSIPAPYEGGRTFQGEILMRGELDSSLEFEVEYPQGQFQTLDEDRWLPGAALYHRFDKLDDFTRVFSAGTYHISAIRSDQRFDNIFTISVPPPVLNSSFLPLRVANYTALQRADSKQEIRVEFNATGLNPETDFVWLEVWPDDGDPLFSSRKFPGDVGGINPRSGVVVIPKGALKSNHAHVAFLSVTRLKSREDLSGLGVILGSANFAETGFEIVTGSSGGTGNPSPVAWALARRGTRFIQLSEATPVPLNTGAPFGAEFYVRTSLDTIKGVSTTPPVGSKFNLEEDEVLPGYYHIGEANTADELSKKFPNGTYRFDAFGNGPQPAASFAIALGAPTVDPTIPPVRARNWSALQVANASQDIRVEWDVAGLNRATDHLRFSLLEEEGDLLMTTGLFPGDPNSLDVNAGFAIIPKGTLRPGRSYFGTFDVTRIPTRDTASLPGATLASAYFTSTFFSIKASEAGGNNGALAIVTEELPLSFPGTEYRTSLIARGGTPPYSWSLTADSPPLPQGLTLDRTTGIIQGRTPLPGLDRILLRLTDAANASVQKEFFILVLPGNEPFIWLDPLAETVEAGDEIELEVIATGAEPLTYQWRLNGVDLRGANDSILEIDSVTSASEGEYTVVVRNAFGTATSRPARISVLSPPEIVRQPQSQSVAAGARVEFSVGVAGTGPFRYQWQLNGDDIPGANAAVFVIPSARPADSGDYTVVVEGPDGALDSDEAELAVSAPSLTLTDRFADRTSFNTAQGSGRGSNRNATREPGEPVHAGEDGGSSVWVEWVAPASGVATFQTRGSDFDTVLAVYTGTSLATLVEVVSDEDSGDFFTSEVRFNAVQGTRYAIAVDGYFSEEGSIILSWDLNVTAGKLPRITVQPQDQIIGLGTAARFQVVAVNEPPDVSPLRYQWFRNGAPLAGATASVLAIPSIGLTDLGLYQVTVQNDAGTIESVFVVLLFSEIEGLLDAAIRVEDKFANAIPLGRPPIGAALRRASLGRGDFKDSGTAAARGYSGSQVFNSFGSSTEEGEPNHCGVIGGASQWFTYQAEADGVLVISTEGSAFDTVLAVYTGTGTDLASLKLEACDNDSGLARTSVVRLNAKAGTLYYVAVDGVNGATGTARLTYQLDAPPRMSAPRIQNGQMRITINAQPGKAYSLQSSPDFVTWTTVHTINATQTSLEFSDAISSQAKARYYRIFTGR